MPFMRHIDGVDEMCEHVNAHDLRDGDCILYYGCVFRLRDRKVWPMEQGFDPVTQGDTITFRTDLLYYPGEDNTSMPEHWAEAWEVQGNKLATWSRIVDWEGETVS